MKSRQGRFLLIIFLVGIGLSILATRLSTKAQQHLRPQEEDDDIPIQLKSFAPVTDFTPFQVQWRIVIAKGPINQKPLQKLDCTKLDCTSTSFLAELTRRYPGMTFTSPISGANPISTKGGWYPSINYRYVHPDFETLHASFSVVGMFTPDKTAPDSRFFVTNQMGGPFHLTFNEFFVSARTGVQVVKTPSLFQPTQLPQIKGAGCVNVGQTILYESFSGYLEKNGKKLKPLDNHLLFCKVERR